MKVSLINTTGDIYGIGLRRLASFLTRSGACRADVVFPVSAGSVLASGRQGSAGLLGEKALDCLADHVADASLIGLSVTAPTEGLAIQVTRHLAGKLPNTPIIWGGTHPTTAPRACLSHADLVCVGEGERALLEHLSRGSQDDRGALGIWEKAGGKVVERGCAAFESDLDRLGFPEFGSLDCQVLSDDGLAPLTLEAEKRLIGGTFWTMFTQGCPYRCSYCANAALTNVDGGYGRVRHYSVDGFLGYLARMRDRYSLRSVLFVDDCFLSLPTAVIRDFSRSWKERIGLPFHCLGMHPLSFDEEKVDLLVDAGLKRVRIGVQSGSERIRREVLKRPYPNETIVSLSRALAERPLSTCDYDFILDVPWEKHEEKVAGLRLLARMKPPFTLNLFHLTFFNATELCGRAKAEGLLDEAGSRRTDRYFDVDNTYLNLLYAIYAVAHIPPRLLEPLVDNPLGRRNIRVPRFLFGLLRLLKDLRILCTRLADRDPTNVPAPLWSIFLLMRPKS